jgi:hypothetical protein
MISAVFVDRPRLAIVISILITLAGPIALAAIPIAQFPDIVPPQVSVSTSYPGANAEVVEQTVAQAILRRRCNLAARRHDQGLHKARLPPPIDLAVAPPQPTPPRIECERGVGGGGHALGSR